MEVSKNCELCQRLAQPSIYFKVFLLFERKLVFGDDLSKDIMFLNRKAVVHIVHIATYFSAVAFLDAYGTSNERPVQSADSHL